jgi:LacI family transcriptional regulator
MVTIKDIARKAKTSIGTVDRVLHDRGRVSEHTREKILRIAKELDYKPNHLARSLSNNRIIQFGVLMPQISPYHHYWEQAIHGIDRAREELRIFKIKIINFLYDGYDEASFLTVSRKALNANLAGLVIVPIMFNDSAVEVIRQIPRRLPYVFFNSTIPQTPCITYVGQDSYQSGQLAGNIMTMMAGDFGTVIVFTLLVDDYHITRRRQGFVDYVTRYSSLTVKVYGSRNTEDHNELYEILDQVFRDNTDIEGIYVTTALTDCVARYLQQNSKARNIRLIGHDLTNENVECLKQGLIHYLIGQRPEMQGYQSIYSLYRHVVLHETVQQTIMMPLDVITKVNVDYFCRADQDLHAII